MFNRGGTGAPRTGFPGRSESQGGKLGQGHIERHGRWVPAFSGGWFREGKTSKVWTVTMKVRRYQTPPFLGIIRREERGRNSVVECLLPKQKVVGSNPIARSILFRGLLEGRLCACPHPLPLNPAASDNPVPSGYHCTQIRVGRRGAAGFEPAPLPNLPGLMHVLASGTN